MKDGIYTYLERTAGKPLIDWGYLLLHPEAVARVWERYLLDDIFRFEVNRRLLSDSSAFQVFKGKFYQYFGDLLEEQRKATKRY